VGYASNMFPHEDSLVPIFLWMRDWERPEQVGTGIYVRMLGQAYLLTAGHVADLRSQGPLCIPTTEGISELEGGIGGNVLAPGQNRQSDKYDVAWIRLSSEVATIAHPTFKPLPRECVDLGGYVLPGEFCSVGGYPVNKGDRQNDTYRSMAFSYVGMAAEHQVYERLGYDPAIHLIVQYNIKQGIFPEGDRTNPPHPRGASGGGIFRLQSDFLYARESAPRHLIGSMHTFIKRENCFVGTRIPAHFRMIEGRFPEEVRAFEAS
jgi:hypothetical protein